MPWANAVTHVLWPALQNNKRFSNCSLGKACQPTNLCRRRRTCFWWSRMQWVTWSLKLGCASRLLMGEKQNIDDSVLQLFGDRPTRVEELNRVVPFCCRQRASCTQLCIQSLSHVHGEEIRHCESGRKQALGHSRRYANHSGQHDWRQLCRQARQPRSLLVAANTVGAEPAPPLLHFVQSAEFEHAVVRRPRVPKDERGSVGPSRPSALHSRGSPFGTLRWWNLHRRRCQRRYRATNATWSRCGVGHHDVVELPCLAHLESIWREEVQTSLLQCFCHCQTWWPQTLCLES